MFGRSERSFGNFPTAFEAVKSFVENALTKLPKIEKGDARAIEIPVRFDEKSAPDLSSSAKRTIYRPTK
jgi:allophanate hydrolase subunit 1